MRCAQERIAAARLCGAAPDGSSVQQHGAELQGLDLDGEPSLSFQKARFHFIPTLRLVRRPRKAFCFISQIAAFSDLHRMRPFPFQARSSGERSMSDAPPGSPRLTAPKRPFLIPEGVKMGHCGCFINLSRAQLRAEIITNELSVKKEIGGVKLTKTWRKEHAANMWSMHEASHKSYKVQQCLKKTHLPAMHFNKCIPRGMGQKRGRGCQSHEGGGQQHDTSNRLLLEQRKGRYCGAGMGWRGPGRAEERAARPGMQAGSTATQHRLGLQFCPPPRRGRCLTAVTRRTNASGCARKVRWAEPGSPGSSPRLGTYT